VTVVLVSDHAGFELKGLLKPYLESLGFTAVDLGVFTSEKPANDYPYLAARAGERIVSGDFDRGIFICGTGIGMAISANKVPGIRAAVCNDLFSAVKSRQHNNANVCALGARILGQGLACEVVRLWLNTEFEGGRHTARVEKYTHIEKRLLP
jgi:ribose 5-phosphate isomerase B